MHTRIAILVLLLVFAACQPKRTTPTTHHAAPPAASSHPAATSPAKAAAPPPATGTAMEDFVPDNFNILDTAAGDLNKDAWPDRILVLAQDDESIANPRKRPLLLLLGQPDQTFKLVARNDNVVYDASLGGLRGEPFSGLVIKRGYFSVEHAGGMGTFHWEHTITFRYDTANGGNWFLHRDDLTEYMGLKEVKDKMKTIKDFGRVPFKEFDVYKDLGGR